MSDGEATDGTRQPTEGNPYTYIYSHDCDCTVTATTWWDGSYTASHPALSTSIVIPLGARPIEGPSRDYAVIEIEAVGRNPGD